MSTDRVETVVTAREDGINRNQMATTAAESTPNVLIKALSPLRLVATRAARTYVQGLLGFLGGGMVGGVVGIVTPADAWGKLTLAAGLALWPTLVSVLQNSGELLAKLDETRPELRA